MSGTGSLKTMKPTKKLFIADPSWRGFLGAMIGARNLGLLSGDGAEISFEFARIEEIPVARVRMYDFIYVIEARRKAVAGDIRIAESRFIPCASRERCVGFFIRSYVQERGQRPFSISVIRGEQKTIRKADKILRNVPELRKKINALVREEDRSEMMKAEAYRTIGIFEGISVLAALA